MKQDKLMSALYDWMLMDMLVSWESQRLQPVVALLESNLAGNINGSVEALLTPLKIEIAQDYATLTVGQFWGVLVDKVKHLEGCTIAVLASTKKTIISQALDGSLTSDMNELDMWHLAGEGLRLSVPLTVVDEAKGKFAENDAEMAAAYTLANKIISDFSASGNPFNATQVVIENWGSSVAVYSLHEFPMGNERVQIWVSYDDEGHLSLHNFSPCPLGTEACTEVQSWLNYPSDSTIEGLMAKVFSELIYQHTELTKQVQALTPYIFEDSK